MRVFWLLTYPFAVRLGDTQRTLTLSRSFSLHGHCSSHKPRGWTDTSLAQMLELSCEETSPLSGILSRRCRGSEKKCVATGLVIKGSHAFGPGPQTAVPLGCAGAGRPTHSAVGLALCTGSTCKGASFTQPFLCVRNTLLWAEPGSAGPPRNQSAWPV